MNMATERKDNSDAWAEMETRSALQRESVRSAAASGNVTEFQLILKSSQPFIKTCSIYIFIKFVRYSWYTTFMPFQVNKNSISNTENA